MTVCARVSISVVRDTGDTLAFVYLPDESEQPRMITVRRDGATGMMLVEALELDEKIVH